MSWAKERLNELLPGVEATLAAPQASTSGRRTTRKIKVASVSSVEGDVTQSTRKGGKKMSCYDLKLELAWVAFEDDDEGAEEEAEEDVEGAKQGEDGNGGDGNDTKKRKERKNEIKGDLKVLEVTTGHEEEDILFEATVTGSAKELSAREAADALKRPVLDVIAAFVSELEGLDL